MKKLAIALVILLLVGGGIYGFLFVQYTHEEGAFDDWHHSLADGREEAAERGVPILVKVGSPM